MLVGLQAFYGNAGNAACLLNEYRDVACHVSTYPFLPQKKLMALANMTKKTDGTHAVNCSKKMLPLHFICVMAYKNEQ